MFDRRLKYWRHVPVDGCLGFGARLGHGLQTASMPTPAYDAVQALQGHWKFELYYSDWWPERISNPPLSWAKWHWSVKGNQIHWSGMKVDDVKLSFSVDPSKSPPQIDMTFLDGPHQGKTLRGIYKFTGDRACQICFADPDANVDRPTDVSYSTTAGRTMVFFERVIVEQPAAKTPPAKSDGRKGSK